MVVVADNQMEILTNSPVQFPNMSTEYNTMPRKLKFKITTKGMRDDSKDKSRRNIEKVIVKNGQTDRVTGRGNKHSEVSISGKPSMPANPRKRRAEMSLDSERGKRWKMDRNLKVQCGNILKELMNHPDGWIFSEPVDPVKLNIPDYFSIITKPMDLGTIKRKLEGDMYLCAEEFAADVRLTFSNAMLYNPPGHSVHKCSKILGANFHKRWISTEVKLRHRNTNVEQARFINDMDRKGQDVKKTVEKNQQDTKSVGLNKAALRIKLSTCRPMSFEEKRELRSELVQVLSAKMMENLETVLKKFGLTGLNKERLDSYIDSTNDETLWKLRRDVKAFLKARDGKVEPARTAQNGCPSPWKIVQKEHCGQSACASANDKQSIDITETKHSSCISLTCQCRLKNGSVHASMSSISLEHEHFGDCKLDCQVKYPLAIHTSSFGLDSDGPGVDLNEENGPHVSSPATAASSVEGWTSFNVQLSPKKASRVAMLKRRFADTIFKATHQMLPDHGKDSDTLSMQQERQRLEREQLEEQARIAAEMKAAEAASLRRKQNDLKIIRERERAAARMALQKMERTVEIDDNVDILKDLEMLCCGSSPDLSEGVKGVHPLERLGLYLKKDYLEEEEEEEGEIVSGEEGEILS